MWPGFPYRRLRPLYDAYLPMTYSTARGRGARYIFRYTSDNVAYLRLATHDPVLPVHVIGGLANGLRAAEANAVVDASRATQAIGVSFYKHSLSGREEWRALRRFDAGLESRWDPPFKRISFRSMNRIAGMTELAVVMSRRLRYLPRTVSESQDYVLGSLEETLPLPEAVPG